MTPITDDPQTSPKREQGPDTSPKRQQGSATTSEIVEPSGTNESHIMQALQEYRTAREAGVSPDRHIFLTRHADIASELSQCLEALDFVYKAAPKFQESTPELGSVAAVADLSSSDAASVAQPPMPLGDYQ